MNRYKIVEQLGDGAYGRVLKAINITNGEVVAIKKMKKTYSEWHDCIALPEVKVLRVLGHRNIVKLKEVIRDSDELHLIFEFMEGNLYQIVQSRVKPFAEIQVRNMMFQTLQGIAHMHTKGFFHRDLKPENLLVNGNGEVVKIADFGLAKEIRSRPPHTEYVATRWYRAPEILLHGRGYNSPVDMWAIGCIMAEVMMLRPLFPGNTEMDQLLKVCDVCGIPNEQEWKEGYILAANMNFRWPQVRPVSLESMMPSFHGSIFEVLRLMLLWTPMKRGSATQALANPFFAKCAVETSNPAPTRISDPTPGRTNSAQAGINSTPKSINAVARSTPPDRSMIHSNPTSQMNNSNYDSSAREPIRPPRQRDRSGSREHNIPSIASTSGEAHGPGFTAGFRSNSEAGGPGFRSQSEAGGPGFAPSNHSLRSGEGGGPGFANLSNGQGRGPGFRQQNSRERASGSLYSSSGEAAGPGWGAGRSNAPPSLWSPDKMDRRQSSRENPLFSGLDSPSPPPAPRPRSRRKDGKNGGKTGSSGEYPRASSGTPNSQHRGSIPLRLDESMLNQPRSDFEPSRPTADRDRHGRPLPDRQKWSADRRRWGSPLNAMSGSPVEGSPSYGSGRRQRTPNQNSPGTPDALSGLMEKASRSHGAAPSRPPLASLGLGGLGGASRSQQTNPASTPSGSNAQGFGATAHRSSLAGGIMPAPLSMDQAARSFGGSSERTTALPPNPFRPDRPEGSNTPQHSYLRKARYQPSSGSYSSPLGGEVPMSFSPSGDRGGNTTPINTSGGGLGSIKGGMLGVQRVKQPPPILGTGSGGGSGFGAAGASVLGGSGSGLGLGGQGSRPPARMTEDSRRANRGRMMGLA